MGRTFHFAMDPMIKGGQSCVLQIGIKSGSNGKFVTVSRQFSVGWWRLGDFWPVTYSYHPPNGWFQFFLWIHNNFTIEYFILKIYIMGRNTKISGFEKTKQSLADQKTYLVDFKKHFWNLYSILYNFINYIQAILIVWKNVRHRRIVGTSAKRLKSN